MYILASNKPADSVRQDRPATYSKFFRKPVDNNLHKTLYLHCKETVERSGRGHETRKPPSGDDGGGALVVSSGVALPRKPSRVR